MKRELIHSTEISNEVTHKTVIDIAHRLPYAPTNSKNIHGHRFEIGVSLVGLLPEKDTSDYGGKVVHADFIETIMNIKIKKIFDHSCLLYVMDPIVNLLHPGILEEETLAKHTDAFERDGYSVLNEYGIILFPFVPSAENLAKLWCEMIERSMITLQVPGRYAVREVFVLATSKHFVRYWNPNIVKDRSEDD